ncbi:MAG: hypothetical protein JWM95_2591 [Gemmatimonadetes bacterium]|nr:hypothetical protein [Gemmatimonadota bacterium]
MTVPNFVTLEQVRAELADVASYAAAAGLGLDASMLSEANPLFYLTFSNRDDIEFVAEFDCRDYPLNPPMIEFVDAAHTRRATPNLYPSCFHPLPCVCARYNRKAYKTLGGPHDDWRLIDWQLPTQAGPKIDSLAMIVSDMHSKIASSTGRMG